MLIVKHRKPPMATQCDDYKEAKIEIVYISNTKTLLSIHP